MEEKGMPLRARLWNDGKKTYSNIVQGELYVIEPGKCYKDKNGREDISRRTAIEVRGSYPGKDVEAALRIEPLEEMGTEDNVVGLGAYECPFCDKRFDDKNQLRGHAASHMKAKKKEG